MAKKKSSGKALEAEVVVGPSTKRSAKSVMPAVMADEIEVEDVETDIDQHPDDDAYLPAPVKEADLSKLPATTGAPADPLTTYIREISRYELLSPDEEKTLTRALSQTGDIEIAKKLVVANLRLVVKIAMEYRSAWQNVMDLIQEGNIGLMKAVSKFDPDKGAKLSYYASWWIRSYILKYILDNFRLIKIGTTQEQKKLFYNLMKEKERLASQGIFPGTKLLSENLGVSEKSVEEMDLRLSSSGQEVSLDRPLDDGEGSGRAVLADLIGDPSAGPESQLEDLQGLEILQEHLQDFVQGLKPRDQEIFKKRLLSEIPASLQAIADEYGVSRERIRQIEERLLQQLRVYMSDFLR